MARPEGSEYDDLLMRLILDNGEELTSSELKEIIEAQTDIPWQSARHALDNLVNRDKLDIEPGKGRSPSRFKIAERWTPDYHDTPEYGDPDDDATEEEDSRWITPDRWK